MFRPSTTTGRVSLWRHIRRLRRHTKKPEDSTGASYCGCKTRCATRRCPCKQIGSVCRKYCHPNRTCVNRQQKPSEAKLSCLSSEEETGISSGVKVWTTIGETTLLEEDKNVLMNGGWLNDKIIYAGMQLLQAAFPHLSGFQNPILQVTNCFDIQRSTEFIQCLNVAGMHWITIATVGCTHGTVRVYDSLNKKLTKSLKNTVADILHSSTKKIEVGYVNVQYHLGSDDCGLFAIANACEICFCRDPSVVKYTQKDMRKHLKKKELKKASATTQMEGPNWFSGLDKLVLGAQLFNPRAGSGPADRQKQKCCRKRFHPGLSHWFIGVPVCAFSCRQRTVNTTGCYVNFSHPPGKGGLK
ncbi:hypothetical protein EMCRGX_G020641 [Ephydatia muelleri]